MWLKSHNDRKSLLGTRTSGKVECVPSNELTSHLKHAGKLVGLLEAAASADTTQHELGIEAPITSSDGFCCKGKAPPIQMAQIRLKHLS